MSSARRDAPEHSHQLADEFSRLTRDILRSANKGVPRREFVREVLRLLADFSESDEVGIRVNDGFRYFCSSLRRGDEASYRFDMATRDPGIRESAGCRGDSPGLTLLCQRMMGGDVDLSSPWFTDNGSFWTDDTSKPVPLASPEGRVEACIDGEHRSLAIIRFTVSEGSHGLVLFWDREPAVFRRYDISFYEGVIQTIGVALADRRAQAALRERVKELTCLYGIDRVLEKPDSTLEESLQGVVELLPPAWLFPEIASARITVDGRSFSTDGFGNCVHLQAASIVVRGRERGIVEVGYSEPRPDMDEGPFLKDERSLIEAVANQVGLVLDHRQAVEERVSLEAQLRHADRLATIGQLAAGVAHEMNEPLGSILGFAQLARKAPGLPESARDDIDKIVSAVLHAREVVSKLMLFARQKPPAKVRVDFNELIEEGLYFLTARCARSGIELVRAYAADLPEIVVDPGQLHQVLVNLMVNAIQAMPEGGRVTIRTAREGEHLVLAVEDTGVGMTDEVRSRIFVPFYTTKGVGEGTGLGLPVVHGIVTGHAGSIQVSSEPGKGTTFRILLPMSEPSAVREEISG